MRLLVSVRSAREAQAAVEGGAELIDAKEPWRGALGAVDSAALAGIAGVLRDGVPLSVALSDHATPRAATRALDLLRAVARRQVELYVKVGLAGVSGPEMARSVLEAAVGAAKASPLTPEVIAVAYADHRAAASLPPHDVLEAAADAGARGVLLDTWTKDGRPVFSWMGRPDIGRWLDEARNRGLLTALAGSLSLNHVELVGRLGPDVFGVRGAACENGRSGEVSAGLVRQLALAKQQAQASLGLIA